MSKGEDKPALIHDALLKIPQEIRFLIQGAMSNVLFLTGYTMALAHLEPLGFSPSSIYAIYYALYIPVGHFQTCIFVFGWPENYIKSLMSVVPIGLSAMVLGTVTTTILEKVDFDVKCDTFLETFVYSLVYGENSRKLSVDDEEASTLYSSVFVMVATGLWTFALTSIVMSKPKEATEKKAEHLNSLKID